MRIWGISGGNGVILHPLKKYLTLNIEFRSVFKTPGNIQWKLNFGDIPLNDADGIQFPDVMIGAPDCGHSSILALSRGKSFGNPKLNESLNHYFRTIIAYQPKIFLFENLTQLLDNYEIDSETFVCDVEKVTDLVAQKNLEIKALEMFIDDLQDIVDLNDIYSSKEMQQALEEVTCKIKEMKGE